MAGAAWLAVPGERRAQPGKKYPAGLHGHSRAHRGVHPTRLVGQQVHRHHHAGAGARRVHDRVAGMRTRSKDLAPTLEEAFNQNRPAVVALPIDYRENERLQEQLQIVV